MRLPGYNVVVTGGASGLGLAIAERFVAEGANVTVFDRNAEALRALTERTGIRGVVGDVRSLADNRRAVDAASGEGGTLDAFIGNAGIWDFNVSLVDLPDDAVDAAFDEIMGVNVKGYLLGVKAAAPALVRGGGAVVLTLSNAAFYAGGGGPLYTAAKHAGVGLVRQLAYELAPYVRVNAVAPGAIASDLRGVNALGQAARTVAEIFPKDGPRKSSAPLGRQPETDEYVAPYVLLASRSEAGPITGAILNADGGLGVRGLRGSAGGEHLRERFGHGGN